MVITKRKKGESPNKGNKGEIHGLEWEPQVRHTPFLINDDC